MKPPFSIVDVEATPGFAAASLEQQNQMRTDYASQYVFSQPEFSSLASEEQLGLTRMLTDRAPILAHPEDLQVKQVQDRIAAAQSGDPNAIAGLVADEVADRSTKNEVFQKLFFAGTDALAALLDPNRHDWDYDLGAEGPKLSAMRTRAIAALPGATPEAMAWLDSGSAVLGTVNSLVEDIGAYMLAVGPLAQGSKLGAEAISLTEKWGQAMKPGMLQRLVSGLGDATVTGLAGAAYSGLKTMALSGLEGEWDKQSIGQVAERFGTDLATNYAMWIGFSAVGTSVKVISSLLKSPQMAKGGQMAARDVDSMVRALIKTLLSSGQLDEATMAQLPADLQAAYRRSSVILKAAQASGKLQTPEDVARVIATGSGFSLEGQAGKYIVKSLEDDVPRGEFTTLDNAVQYVHANANVPSPPPAGGIAAENAKVEFKDKVIAPKVDDPKTLAKLFEDQTDHRVDSREYVAKNLFEASGVDSAGLRFIRMDNDKFFEALGGSAEYGVKGEVAAQAETFRAAYAAAVKDGLVYIPKDIFLGAGQEALFLDGLRQGILARGGSATLGEALAAELRPGTRGALTGMSRASKTALSAIVKIRWGPEARLVPKRLPGEAGVSYVVTIPAPKGTRSTELFGQEGRQVVMSEPGEQSFRMALLQELQKSNALSKEQVAWAVSQSSGLSLTEVVHKARGAAAKGATVSTWDLKTPGGRTVASFKDLSEVLQQESLFGRMLKMPEEFGPRAYVSDTAKNELTFEGPLVEGSPADLFELRAQYDKPFTGIAGQENKVLKAGLPEGSEAKYLPGSRSFVYRAYEGAAPREFGTFKELQSYAKLQQASLDGLRYDARIRGYELIVGREGSATLFDGITAKRFSTRKALKAYYAKNPVADDMPEIMPGVLDDSAKAKLDAEMSKVRLGLGTLGPGRKGFRAAVERGYQRIMNPELIVQTLGTTESALSIHAQKTGNRSFLDMYHNVINARRLTNTESRKYVPYVDEVWGSSSVTHRDMLGTLLSVDRSKWKDCARNLYEIELGADDLVRLDKTQSFLNIFAKGNGLDGIDAIYARKAELQAALQKALNEGKDLAPDATTFIKEALGGPVPRSLSLFADGLSRTDLMNFFDETDPAMAMMAIIDKVHRQRFFGPLQEKLAQTVLDARELIRKGELTEGALAFFQNSLDEAQGIKTTLGLNIAERSRKVSHALANLADKSTFLRNLGLGAEIRTDDIVGKLGMLFTNNSQAFRAWAIPRNLTQVYLLGAVTGNGKMWKAFQYVLDNPKYMDGLYSRGAMQESILSMGDEAMTPLKRIQKIGLAPLEVSDGITRATAIRAAEESVDKALPRLKSGLTDANQFLREVNADFLPDASRLKFMELLRTNETAAKDFLGQQFQSATMGDYSRGALGYATRGVIGRLFGKLGTYPLFTIDLYRRILTSGTATDRLARAARLVATSYAIYHAFQSAGASYDGFLWSDPFSFSGGPYWSILTNATNSFGDRPENKMARASLSRQLVTSIVPGAMLAPYLGRAAKALDEGDPLAFLRAVGTVPMSQEERLRRAAQQ